MRKILTQFVALFIIVFLFQSCDDNPTFLEENSKKQPGFIPVLNVTGDYTDQYSPGDTVNFVMQYFSRDDIDAITLDEQIALSNGDTTQNQVFSKPAGAGSFSERLDLDTLAVSYKVGQQPDSTEITLKSKVLSTNDLADSVSITFMIISD